MSDNVKEVLDHGHVRLVSYMQPVERDADWSGDMEIVRNARVSYNAERRKPGKDEEDKDEKLVNYLLKNRHTSPLESMVFTFDIKCPIFVARQWMRHRTWSYNEVSARYTQLPSEMYVPKPELMGVQSKDNKQMRIMKDWDDMDYDERKEAESMVSKIEAYNNLSYMGYQDLLDSGAPRELARGVLAFNIYTHYFGTVDMHNLMHFLTLRLHPHAQYEIRVYANAMLDLIEPIAPMCVGAYKRHMLKLNDK